MHENREISSTPWSGDQGRSAKAINRNADVYVPEKSHCAVVPVNQPNKEGEASTEAGEGRAQMKENIVQSRMPLTQSGNRMSQGLDGVRKQQRKGDRNGSLPCSTISTLIFSATAFTRFSVRLRREWMACDGRSMKPD